VIIIANSASEIGSLYQKYCLLLFSSSVSASKGSYLQL